MHKQTQLTVKNVSENDYCTYCDNKGYIVIHNAYDADFRVEERCTLCEMGEVYSQSN